MNGIFYGGNRCGELVLHGNCGQKITINSRYGTYLPKIHSPIESVELMTILKTLENDNDNDYHVNYFPHGTLLA